MLSDYGVEITAMNTCYEGICFATITGLIYIWDGYLLNCHKKIDINQFPFKILSNFIVSMDHNQRRLLLLTMNGDAIEVLLGDGSGNKQVKAQRLNSIVRITCR